MADKDKCDCDDPKVMESAESTEQKYTASEMREKRCYCGGLFTEGKIRYEENFARLRHVQKVRQFAIELINRSSPGCFAQRPFALAGQTFGHIISGNIISRRNALPYIGPPLFPLMLGEFGALLHNILLRGYFVGSA